MLTHLQGKQSSRTVVLVDPAHSARTCNRQKVCGGACVALPAQTRFQKQISAKNTNEESPCPVSWDVSWQVLKTCVKKVLYFIGQSMTQPIRQVILSDRGTTGHLLESAYLKTYLKIATSHNKRGMDGWAAAERLLLWECYENEGRESGVVSFIACCIMLEKCWVIKRTKRLFNTGPGGKGEDRVRNRVNEKILIRSG